MSHPLAIGLGGNLGTDQEILARFRAVKTTLATALGNPLRASPVYRTQPIGPVSDQPSFLNAVLIGPDPQLDPMAVVAALLDLEVVLGRDRKFGVAQGPREIDLDLLLAGGAILARGGPAPVVVPHPRIGERAFVLAPLCDLLGRDYCIPGFTRSLGELLDGRTTAGVVATALDF